MSISSYLVTIEQTLEADASAAWNAAKTSAAYVENAVVTDVSAAVPTLVTDLENLIKQIGEDALSTFIKSLTPGAAVTVPVATGGGT